MRTVMPEDPNQSAMPDARPMRPVLRPGRLGAVPTRSRSGAGALRSIADRRRIATGALALGLALATSLIPVAAEPAWAIDYKAVSIATKTFSKRGLVEKNCLLRAEQALLAGGFRVWDVADDGDRTVQGESTSAQVLVTCVKEGEGTWGLVNVYADSVDEASRLAEAVQGKILAQAGSGPIG